MQIPIIDLGAYRRGELSAQDKQTLALACEDHGFFLLSGHGEDAVVERVFSQSAAFFAQSTEVKLKVRRDADNPLGYYDRELTKQKRDQKEVFDFKAGGHISSNPARHTRWPSTPEGFRPALSEFFAHFTDLAEDTMRMIFSALSMPDAEIAATMRDGFGPEHSSAGRLNFYPAHDPVPLDEQSGVTALGNMALHHHTDPGAITLLLQDDHGGLQARSKRDGWIDVPPVAGTIVVNVGDVLQVWTNDRCTAGVHRVLPVNSPQGRFSTPFFYQPRIDATISPWVTPGERARYRPFSWREFIGGRVADNFADAGEDDIQIAKYRMAV